MDSDAQALCMIANKFDRSDYVWQIAWLRCGSICNMQMLFFWFLLLLPRCYCHYMYYTQLSLSNSALATSHHAIRDELSTEIIACATLCGYENADANQSN